METEGHRDRGIGRRVVLLREARVCEVAALIAAASTQAEEAEALERGPEILFSQGDPIGVESHYADFNIRSRHFRVIETFFLEIDQNGGLDAVIAIDGLKRNRPVAKLQLVVAKPVAGLDPAEHLCSLLEGVLAEARCYAPGLTKLRLIYVFEPTLDGALGSHVARMLIDRPEDAGLAEEVRIANETGPGREAVFLSCGARPLLQPTAEVAG